MNIRTALRPAAHKFADACFALDDFLSKASQFLRAEPRTMAELSERDPEAAAMARLIMQTHSAPAGGRGNYGYRGQA